MRATRRRSRWRREAATELALSGLENVGCPVLTEGADGQISVWLRCFAGASDTPRKLHNRLHGRNALTIPHHPASKGQL